MITGDAYRGAYLARTSGCIACHTNAAAGGAALAGGAPLDTPFGTFVPPNLTPDPAGGIGGWTLDQFAVAVILPSPMNSMLTFRIRTLLISGPRFRQCHLSARPPQNMT
jgi:hypothetical protein